MRSLVWLTVLATATGAWAGPFDGTGAWVDLTHELAADSVFWPTAEPFELTVDAEGITDLGYYYSAYSFRAAEHGGTHIDAPVHFAKGQQSVDLIPLSRLIGNAVVVDVSANARASRDYQVTVEDLEGFENSHGVIAPNTIVLLRTGYSSHWPDAAAYLGTAERGAAGAAKLHFPGLHPQAAAWLVNKKIASVGIDTASIDYGASKRFASHVALMTANIPAFENLTNLDTLPATGASVVALPAKIKGGSGGPLRIVAWVPDAP
jgi:kynurenine formamidase